jgi:hypothetical protein
MKAAATTRFARGFAAVAGLGDFATGCGLLLAPDLTLRAMGVAPRTGEALTFLQFVGAFVAAVGASYLLALASRRLDRLWAVFRVTTLFRLAVGSFVAWAVATGRLEPRWLAVTCTDGLIAGTQLWLLSRQEPTA